MSNQTELLTIQEMADILKVNIRWLYARTREKDPGSIPRIKVGRYLRFEESAVLDWLRNNTNQQ